MYILNMLNFGLSFCMMFSEIFEFFGCFGFGDIITSRGRIARIFFIVILLFLYIVCVYL